jgi:hypothetical protein
MGPYAALDLEKILSIRESLAFRFELFMPYYEARGVWPQRTEWNDFIDKGGFSLGYSIGATYTMKITPTFGIYGSLSWEYINSGNMDTVINWSDGVVTTDKKSIVRAEWEATIMEVGLKYKF